MNDPLNTFEQGVSVDYMRAIFMMTCWGGFLRAEDSFIRHGIKEIRRKTFCRLNEAAERETVPAALGGHIDRLRAHLMEGMVHHLFETAKLAGDSNPADLLPMEAMEALLPDQDLRGNYRNDNATETEGAIYLGPHKAIYSAPISTELFGYHLNIGILPIGEVKQYQQKQAETLDKVIAYKRKIAIEWPDLADSLPLQQTTIHYRLTACPQGKIR